MEDQTDGKPMWCVVANVREGIYYGPNQGDWVQIGTKHFSPGTKVYVVGVNWDAEFTKIRVVGKHRGSPRLVAMVMRPSWLTNWRAKVIYEPKALRKIREGGFPRTLRSFPTDDSEDSREKAEHLAQQFAENFPPLRQDSAPREQE